MRLRVACSRVDVLKTRRQRRLTRVSAALSQTPSGPVEEVAQQASGLATRCLSLHTAAQTVVTGTFRQVQEGSDKGEGKLVGALREAGSPLEGGEDSLKELITQ